MRIFYSCPNDSIICEDGQSTTPFGWVLLVFILLAFTLPDVIDGISVYYYSALSRDIKGTLTGLTLISVSSITMVASLVYLYATSISNSALIKDSVAILFLNSIDEQVFKIAHLLMPSWVQKLEDEMKDYCPSVENSSIEQVDWNDEDMHIEVESVDAERNSIAIGSNSEENEDSASQNIAVLFAHVEKLNDQIEKMHRKIEYLENKEKTETATKKTEATSNESKSYSKLDENNTCSQSNADRCEDCLSFHSIDIEFHMENKGQADNVIFMEIETCDRSLMEMKV